MKLCRVHEQPALDQRDHKDGKCAACVRAIRRAEAEKKLRGACLD